jgi:L-seryl-tRNA(Ser) seleniumtransferase/D-glucosaminate-6-phosphate ammonia-lyase
MRGRKRENGMSGRDYYGERFGLPEVINASGRMTVIGGSIMPPEVLEVLVDSAPYYVELRKLQDKASEVIARVTGAEAGHVTAGAAAGIVIATAACIAGTDREKGMRLPDTTGMRNEVILQAAHNIGWARMCRLPGGKTVFVGSVEAITPQQIEEAINESTASIHFIVSHWIRERRAMVPLKEVVEIAHHHDVPVTVDAAAEHDLKKYIAAGADLVIYSGGKEIEGPNDTGFICGRRDLIDACEVQGRLIGRPMKVSKEQICAFLTALERHARKDWNVLLQEQRTKLEHIQANIADLPHVKTRITRDETGRPIVRLEVEPDLSTLGMTVQDIINLLREGDPIIVVRGEYRDLGKFHLDPRPLLPGQEQLIAERLRAVLTKR